MSISHVEKECAWVPQVKLYPSCCPLFSYFMPSASAVVYSTVSHALIYQIFPSTWDGGVIDLISGGVEVAQLVKNPPAMQETWVRSWVGKIPWRRAWQPTPIFLPGKSPWTKGPGRLQSMGLQKVGQD